MISNKSASSCKLLKQEAFRLPYARDRVDLVRSGKVTKLKFPPVMLLDTVTVLREAAIEGAGFTSLPEWMAARDIAAGRLIQLLPDWHIEPVDLHLAHAIHEQLPERVRSLLEYLEAEIPQEIHKLDLGRGEANSLGSRSRFLGLCADGDFCYKAGWQAALP